MLQAHISGLKKKLVGGLSHDKVTVPLEGDAGKVFDDLRQRDLNGKGPKEGEASLNWANVARKTPSLTAQGMQLSFFAPEIREGVSVARLQKNEVHKM